MATQPTTEGALQNLDPTDQLSEKDLEGATEMFGMFMATAMLSTGNMTMSKMMEHLEELKKEE